MISEILGYKLGRNLSKVILLLTAIAISTFAVGMQWLNYDLLSFGFPIKNYIAVALVIVALLIKDDILNPYVIPFTDRGITKYVYYVALGIIAIDISTISFLAISNILNIEFLGFEWFTIRNIVAGLMIFSVRQIHVSG